MMNKIHITDQEFFKIHLFSALSPSQLHYLRAHMQRYELQCGELLFSQGQAAQQFFLIQSGQIKLSRLALSGHEKIVEIMSAQQTFAEAVMFMQQQSYPVNAQALKSSVVIGVNNDAFLNMLRQSPATCFQLLAKMSIHLHQWLNELDRLTQQNATYRLIHFLQQRIPQQAQLPLEIHLETPKHILASQLSIQPETLSRIFKQLTQAGILSVEGKRVRIHSLEKLYFYNQDV